jgi:hypothetical protein
MTLMVMRYLQIYDKYIQFRNFYNMYKITQNENVMQQYKSLFFFFPAYLTLIY